MGRHLLDCCLVEKDGRPMETVAHGGATPLLVIISVEDFKSKIPLSSNPQPVKDMNQLDDGKGTSQE